MLLNEVTPVFNVVLISGVISVLALLISKISNLFGSSEFDAGAYECGFIRKKSEFQYSSESSEIISMFLVLELLVAWLLFCCTLSALGVSLNGKEFIRFFIGIFFISLMFMCKVSFLKKEK